MTRFQIVLATALCVSLAGLSACDDSSQTTEKAKEQTTATAPAEKPATAPSTAAPATTPGTAAPATPAETTTTAPASPPAAAETAAASAAERAGLGKFDANGQVPCAQEAGQTMQQCDFGVARESGGGAAVVVTLPDGRKRVLFFAGGKFVSADTSQADGYPEASAVQEGDLHKVNVGDERYEIPEAVISGG